ncbi:MAG: response regulator [Eubacteriales bacterium]|nr:response regulator [Eubacteriales bacterium]
MLKAVLADDEKKVVLLLQKLIDWGKLGYEIVGIANDGIRALELVKETQPQLLITDIRMPGCDGIELIRQARAIQPKIHFIIISGYSQFEYAQSALRYGVEDYILKPLKKEELTGILLRIREKLGEESELEYRRKKDQEKRQMILFSLLRDCADGHQAFLSADQANDEFGFHFAGGYYGVALIKPDISNAEDHKDGYRLMMQHSLEIVRKEVGLATDESAVAILKEGIAVVIHCENYQVVGVKQCFTKIRKEIEKQRDLFWDIKITVCLGSIRTTIEQLTDSMREALWLCRDRICKNQVWRDAASEEIPFDKRYQMDSAQKKRFHEAAEYLNVEQFKHELKKSTVAILGDEELNGQMVEDWFDEIVRACMFGMEQSGKIEECFFKKMKESFWYCTSVQRVAALLERNISRKLLEIKAEKTVQETRPITEAKKYIQEHYQEALRLEDVSGVVGFNATYFSTLFKKETGQNFTDYLTDLRIKKAKELLCEKDIMVSDAAEMVGYRDLKYFSRLFKKTTGINPSDYKKLYR